MIAAALSCSLAAATAQAAELDLLEVGVRAQVWDQSILGKDQPEAFEELDLTATLRLPWRGRTWPDWRMSARLLASAGLIRGAGHTGIVASAIPAVAFTYRERVTLDFGAGLAFLSRYRFGDQDYGGPLQFALTLGLGIPVHRRVGVGYRFMHYSDARVYGPETVGADFHMLELNYRF